VVRQLEDVFGFPRTTSFRLGFNVTRYSLKLLCLCPTGIDQRIAKRIGSGDAAGVLHLL
jgi:hypothetical protein